MSNCLSMPQPAGEYQATISVGDQGSAAIKCLQGKDFSENEIIVFCFIAFLFIVGAVIVRLCSEGANPEQRFDEYLKEHKGK